MDDAELIYFRLAHISWASCCWRLHCVVSQGFPSPPSASGELQNHPWIPLFCLPLEWQLSLFSAGPIIIFISAAMSSNSQCKIWREKLLLHSKELHKSFSITVQSPFWWRLSFKIFFFSGCTFPVLWLHTSLDERNLSWHLMLAYSLPDHLLLHFLSSYHRWQALPSHSAIELWGILASFGCLSEVTWKYMLTMSRNTHRRNSNRYATVRNVNKG